MNFATIYDHALSLPGATEDFPFGDDTLVFKVAGKMFGLIRPESLPPRINLKCDPERAIELREKYASILPGYHMNKKHWNTVICDGDLPEDLVIRMIEESWQLVVAGMPKKRRESLRGEI